MEKATLRGALLSVLLTRRYSGYQIRKEVDGACGTCRGEERYTQCSGGEN